MDTASIYRLKEEQQKALQECQAKTANWKKFKADYVDLKHRLQTLPDKTSYNIMVPFGSLAFMPGRMVHTNEILVLLGDNWFAECSAKHSCEIIGRRLKEIDKNLEDLAKEKQLFDDYLGFTSEFAQEKTIDIQEPFDEEKEKILQEHRKKKNLENKKQKLPESEKERLEREEFEKKLWARLDDLERQEEELDKLAKISSDEEDSQEEEEISEFKKKTNIDNQISLNQISNEKQTSLHNGLPSKEKLFPEENALQFETKDNFSSEGLQKPVTLDLTQQPMKRKVKWKTENDTSTEKAEVIETEIDEELTFRITFKHSPGQNEFEMPEKVDDNSAILPVLQSPSDIYKVFCSTPSPPKSILKSPRSSESSLDLTKEIEPIIMPDQSDSITSISTAFDNIVPIAAVSDLVVERTLNDKNGTCSTESTLPKKPLSKFKASRQIISRR